jgi:small subunit ribosomal protein S6
MQQYELTVLVHPDLETEIEKTITTLKSLVTDNGGKVVKEDNWGKKKLAYSIKKQDFAVYLSMDVELPAPAPLVISNNLNISDYCLRYLLVKVDEKELSKREESKKRAANNEEEQDHGKKY